MYKRVSKTVAIQALTIAVLGCGGTIDPADELIHAHIRARGGEKALKALHSLTYVGTYTEPTFTQIHRFDMKRPNLIRITTS